jgi:hypothetical protein
MPPSSRCFPALIALSVALCTGLLTSAPRDAGGGRDRDTVVRPVRGALQRLDSGEAVEHASDHDLIVWPSADGIDRSGGLVAIGAPPSVTGDGIPDAAAEAAERPSLPPDSVQTLTPTLLFQAHPLAQSGRLPLGRAPPLL